MPDVDAPEPARPLRADEHLVKPLDTARLESRLTSLATTGHV